MRTGKRESGTTLALSAALVLLAVPSSAGAAVTIGSDLAPDPTASGSWPGVAATTATHLALPGAPVSSPTDGVVVRWRVRVGGTDIGGNTARLKVVRPAAGGAYTAVNSSPTGQIPNTSSPTTYEFATQQPINADDLVALDVDGPNGSFLIRTAPLSQPGVQFAIWQPPLADGTTRTPATSMDNAEHTFNADIEPDCDADGFGDETQDPDISSCSPDTAAPDTTFTRIPKNKVKTFSRRADVLFEFVSSEPGSTFGCSLDDKAFEPCDSPHVFKVKAKRKKAKKHEFEVRATDAAGNVDPTPASDTFKAKRKRRR